MTKSITQTTTHYKHYQNIHDSSHLPLPPPPHPSISLLREMSPSFSSPSSSPTWTLLRPYFIHLSRRKPPPLTLVPITLACITTFLLLLYMSFTSNHLLLHHPKAHSSPNIVISKVQNDHFTPLAVNSSSVRQSPVKPSPVAVTVTVTRTENNTSNNYKKRKLEDNDFFFNDTTPMPPTTLFSSINIGSSGNYRPKDDEEDQENPSTLQNNDEVYHDEEIFLQNYEEMKKTLKIYIYPHKKNDPFASSLLPVNNEPGGNYASEAYFKNVLFTSRFVTSDPHKADLFFLPFSIASLRNDKKVGVGGLKDFVRDYMANVRRTYPYWNRTAGADHFYVACHSIGRMAMEKVEYVKSNAIQVVCSSSYFLPNYYTHKDVSLPQIWPRHDEPPDLGLTKRKRLAFFAGAMNSPLRKTVYQAWQNDSSIFVHSGRMKAPYSEQLLGSKYCLHVKGFEVNTARIGDSIYYGCVPVVLADHYDLPFMDILNWKSFSVIVTSSDIPNLKKILRSISSKEYSILQANVLKVRKHFQWNKSPREYDTFYMVMYELWLRRSSVRLSTV